MKSLSTLIVLIALLHSNGMSECFGQGSEDPSPPPEAPRQRSASSTGFQIGLYGAGMLVQNSAEFVTLPGVISCQGDSITYGGSVGGGFVLAAVIGSQPSAEGSFASHLGWQVKAGISRTESSFETEERIGQSISPQGELSDVISQYSINAALTSIIIEPTLYYRLSSSTRFDVMLAPHIGIGIAGSFDQSEAILSPAEATFSDGQVERNVRSGVIDDRNGLNFGGTLGIAYSISISPIVTLRPEISATLSLSEPVKEVTWKQHPIRAGISILFNPGTNDSTPLDPTAN